MARTRKSSLASKASRRRSGWRLLLAMLLALALTASPASSFSLPVETPTVPVETPTVPIKTPTVPVKTPTVPVKTPTVPVKVPTVPVKVPTVPVKTPTVPVKTPTVPVKVPTVPVKVPTVPVKTPSVPVKVPTVPVKKTTVPSVPVKAPSTPIKVPGTPSKTTTAKAPAVSVKTPTIAGRGAEVGVSPSGVSVKGSASGKALTSASARGGASVSAPSGQAGAGQGTAPSGAAGAGSPGGYAGPGAGYGELPSFEGVRDGTGRARIARRERRLKAVVARLGACLSALPDTQRRLLELRTGFGPAKALSPRAAAARLHIGNARFATLEKQALGELSSAASTHACGRTSQIVTGAMSFIAAGLGGGDGAAAAQGGVEGARYEKAPSAGAGGPKTDVSSKPLFGVGLPGVDLFLLLLIPLFLIGLTIVELVLPGTRRGPWTRLLGRGSAVHTLRRRNVPRPRR
jgi:hypothetical protein